MFHACMVARGQKNWTRLGRNGTNIDGTKDVASATAQVFMLSNGGRDLRARDHWHDAVGKDAVNVFIFRLAHSGDDLA